VVLAFVLLSSSSLLSKSLKRALETPVGFNPTQILTGNIALPLGNYGNAVSRLSFVEGLLSAIRTLPGITGAAVNTQLPFNGLNSNHVMAVEGVSMNPGENVRTHYLSAVAGDYWSIMKIPLIRGRLLENADNHRLPTVCVIDQAFAERYWPGGDPLGHRISQSGDTFDSQKAYTIIGVVADVKQSDLTESAGHGSVYIPYSASNLGSFAVVLNSALPQWSLAPMVQKAIFQLDPGVPLNDLHSMQSRIDDSLVARRSPAILSEIFAVIALALAAIGTYGVLGYAVTQRRREIGIRMALGATPAEICRQFLSLGLRLIVVGIFLGIFGAWSAGHAIQAILYDISAFDAANLGTAIVIISAITVTACFLPARRASRVDPLIALRAE
jgi:predicted permease